MRSLWLVLLAGFAFGCSSPPSSKQAVGAYTVMITLNGVSDPDIMVISPGDDGTILITFTAGITTDAGAPNANGLRADLKSETQFTLKPQPAHIDHSTGNLSGSVSGTGSVTADGSVMLDLSYAPTNGTAGMLAFTVSGSRQQ
jgi:hypothetical protein